MKKGLIIVLIVLAGFVLMLGSASAQIQPYLSIGGNYDFSDDDNDGIGLLTFTDLKVNQVEFYTDWSSCGLGWCPSMDAIVSNSLSMYPGTLTSDVTFTASLTSSSPGVFGSGTFSVVEQGTGRIFFTADIDGLDTNVTWNNLSNVTAGSAHTFYNATGNSQYVNELLTNGNGVGNIKIDSWTPGGGGTEDFIGSSSGAVGITVAAPEPISAVLFIIGGATLAFRRYRNKRI